MLRSSALKILHVEDNDADAEIIRYSLGNENGSHPTVQKYALKHVVDLQKALSALTEEDFDAVLLDMNLPDGRGVHNIRSVRVINPDVAIIVVTSSDDDDLAVKVLHEELLRPNHHHHLMLQR